MAQYAFERDRYWKASARLVRHVYQVSMKIDPEEKAGLTAQIRRVAIALPVRLAEYATATDVEAQRNSLEAALDLLREMRSYFLIAQRLQFVSSILCWRTLVRIGNVRSSYTRRIRQLEVPQTPLPAMKQTFAFRHLKQAA